MTKSDHENGDLIDLGAASVETHGGTMQQFLDTGIQKYAPVGLHQD